MNDGKKTWGKHKKTTRRYGKEDIDTERKRGLMTGIDGKMNKFS